MFEVFCRGCWIIERNNLLWAGYASTLGYASKLRLRVLVFLVFCRGCWIIERGNFLCAGYASTRGYASKYKLRVKIIVKQLLKIELHFHKALMEKAPGLFVLFGYLGQL